MSEQKSRGGALHGISSHCKVCGDRASGKHYGEKMFQIGFINKFYQYIALLLLQIFIH